MSMQNAIITIFDIAGGAVAGIGVVASLHGLHDQTPEEVQLYATRPHQPISSAKAVELPGLGLHGPKVA